MTAPYDGVAAAVQAMTQVGKRYVFKAAGPDAYDCSGSTMVAAAAGGVVLPHQSAQQTKADRVHTYGPGVHAGKLARWWLREGDICFWYGHWPDHWNAISHVATYVGRIKGVQMIVNATNEARGVELIPLMLYGTPCAYGYIDTLPWAKRAYPRAATSV